MASLELTGPPEDLIDEPLVLRVRGSGGAAGLTWRARVRDDDGRVWRAIAPDAAGLGGAWVPAKSSTDALMALGSLRPVELELRVEAPDGRAASRTLVRRLLAPGVRRRRWREGALTAVLHLPVGDEPVPAVVLDATGGEDVLAVATLAAPLLASRGVVALVVAPPRRGDGEAALAEAVTRLAAIPAAAGPPQVLPVHGAQATPVADGASVGLPPGIGVRGAGAGPQAAQERAVAWDTLLAALGARPRVRPGDR